jgi:hypothetical protein
MNGAGVACLNLNETLSIELKGPFDFVYEGL